MTSALLPANLVFRAFTQTGTPAPLAGGKLYFYQAGTSTPQAAYSDATGLTPLANPLPLDANGQANFWLKSGLIYKINLTDSAGVQQAGWPADNIVADTAGAVLVSLADTSTVFGGDALVFGKRSEGGALPFSYHSYAQNREINVKTDFGAKGDGLTDDLAAINAAISAVSADGGGTLYFPIGVYGISSKIILKRGVRLKGAGMSDYTLYPTMFGTTIKPLPGFSDPHVILADSATDGTTLLSGVGIEELTIDCVNIPSLANRIISLRSVTNPGVFRNISVFNLDDGFALSINKSAISGGLPSDGCIFEGFFTYGKTVYTATQARCEIYSSNEITFIGCKFQGKSGAAAGTVGVFIGDLAHGISFYDCSFAGVEVGVNIYDNAGIGAAPMFISVINCIFEGYRIGISIDGSGSNPLFYPTRIFCAGNRFFTATGSNIRNYYVNKSTNVMIIADDYVEAGSGGTSYIVQVDYACLGCRVEALPSSCLINIAAAAVVYGRNGNALQISSLYRPAATAPALATGWTNISPTNRTSAGYWLDAQGVVHLQGYVGYSSGGTTTIFTLPAGFIPIRCPLIPVITNTGPGSILVDQSTGVVSQLTGGTGWISLDGVQFPLT